MKLHFLETLLFKGMEEGEMVFQTQTKTQNVAQQGIENKNDHSEKPKGSGKNARTPGGSIPEMTGRVGAVEWECGA